MRNPTMLTLSGVLLLFVVSPLRGTTIHVDSSKGDDRRPGTAAEPAKKTWTVFYFTRVNDSRTKVRTVVLGYDSSEPSRQLRAFFEQGNKQSLNQLAKSFTREPAKLPK